MRAARAHTSDRRRELESSRILSFSVERQTRDNFRPGATDPGKQTGYARKAFDRHDKQEDQSP
jgi:hypothetical protein